MSQANVSLEHTPRPLAWFRIQTEPGQLRHWSELFHDKPRLRFSKGATILQQSQPVEHLYYVQSGLVEYIYCDPDGNEHLIDVMAAGHILGLPSLFSADKLAMGDLRALSRVELSMMPMREVYRYIEADPVLSKELLEESSRIVGAMAMQAYSKSIPAESRIIQALYLLAESVAKSEPDRKTTVSLNISQNELARICHTTRVTATKTLKKLKSTGLVDTTYRYIVVLDRDALHTQITASATEGAITQSR